ncbi:MAG: hypothetical protein HKO62_06345, partial [Gammaproteobacteria bacterium]|nr:hypothetical protein [Gammaproteobacteria bacterium]
EQNRVFLGVGGRLAGRLSGEIGYQLQHINRPGRSALSLHQLFVALSASLN